MLFIYTTVNFILLAEYEFFFIYIHCIILSTILRMQPWAMAL